RAGRGRPGRGVRARTLCGDDARPLPAGHARHRRGLRRGHADGGAAHVSASSADSRPGPGRVGLAGAESRLRSRRGLVTLWVVTTGAVAVVTLLMELGGVPGWDDAAHAYKVLLLRDGDSVFWDTYWYGGGYGAITYGFVFYWLAQYVSGAIIVIL